MKMRSLWLCLLLTICGVAQIMAVPAKKGAVKMMQPDGTSVMIELHGDEWSSFQTTADGYTVVKDGRGFYVYAQKVDGALLPTKQVAHDQAERSDSEQAFLAGVKKFLTPKMSEAKAEMRSHIQELQRQTLAARRAGQYNYNNFKGLIILVQFNDKKFSRTDYPEILNDMVNKENYTGYDNQQYTGSVRDYFSDNSTQKFKPEFDVKGPYTIDYSQYDCQGGFEEKDEGYDPARSRKITKAVLDAADDDIDFTQYDGDGNGIVDLVFFIFAGNGANYNGNDKGLWWPHRSYLYTPDYKRYRKDGKLLGDYASSVELAGYTNNPSSVKIDGIGTICHEFSHVLGLPDFYDTNYAEDGRSDDPGEWSIMAGGSYVNDSRTPVGYSLYERWVSGFLDSDPQLITQEGSYTLNPLYSSNTGFRLNTPVEDEFFLFENRQPNAFKWDRGLPRAGMLVHRVDKTDQSVWSTNKVNAYADHNYYEVVRAGGVMKYNGVAYAASSDLFPGSTNVTQLLNTTSPANLLTWEGKPNQFGLTNIAVSMSTGAVTFNVTTYKLTALSMPTEMTIAAGISQQLTVTPTPSNADYTLTWTSDNPAVAKVNAEGFVTGVAQGECTVTATSDNGIKATCKVTVVEIPTYSIADLKQQPVGEELLLKLEDAEVLFAYTSKNIQTAYVRDASGALMIYNADLNLKTNDVVNGTVMVKTAVSNNVPQAVGLGEQTNANALTIVAGPEVTPREVKFEDLTEADYSDLVVVKSAKIVRDNGFWAYSGDQRARIWAGKFSISTGLTSSMDFSGKYFDITAIYGTNVLNQQVINELEVTKAVEEVSVATAISVYTDKTASDAYYNLHGQRVDESVKGILIHKGKKIVNR